MMTVKRVSRLESDPAREGKLRVRTGYRRLLNSTTHNGHYLYSVEAEVPIEDFEEALARLAEEENSSIPPGQVITEILGDRSKHRLRRIEDVSGDLLKASAHHPGRKYLHFSPTFGRQVICEELYDWLAGRID